MKRSSMSPFSSETPESIRRQILDYHATACMTDVERALYFGLPKGCRIREGAKIICPENLEIGEDCWIGEGAILDASGGLCIGNNTSIGLGVYIWTHDSHKLNIRAQNTREHSHRIKRNPTKIGSQCFISGPSVIMPGAEVGDKCIIRPMSVVEGVLRNRTIFDSQREVSILKKQNDELRERLDRLERMINNSHS